MSLLETALDYVVRGFAIFPCLAAMSAFAGFDPAITAALTAGGGLRPYQANAVTRIRDAVAAGKRRIMLMLATGAGKTKIAGAIGTGFQSLGKRVLFVVPAIELVDQTIEKFYHEGIYDVGVMQATHHMTDSSKRVQIASGQTLMRRRVPPADLVFVDEAHRWFDFYRKWFLDPVWRDVPFIGLSATPWTKGLGAYYDELIIAATTQNLIDQGYLSKFRVFAPDHPDLGGVRTVAGDYHEGDLGAAMDKAPLVADIVETWKRLGLGRPTPCFAVNRVHAKHLQQQFQEAGFQAGYIDCFTPADERTIIRQKFHSGEFQVVCNVGVLTIGIDWDVRCIILARPTKSEMLFVQIIGRGLRTAAGKDHCLILDHSDTTSRLGFVTDIHHDQLHDGKTREYVKRDHVKLPKECPECHCLRPASTLICPNCGFVVKPVNKIKPVDGELVEMVSRSKAAPYDKDERARWHGMLAAIGLQRGYKMPSWAAANYKEKFGTWPPYGNVVQPIAPTVEVLNWVKSRQIAYAKRTNVA
jgi:DNA repair protein RadD